MYSPSVILSYCHSLAVLNCGGYTQKNVGASHSTVLGQDTVAQCEQFPDGLIAQLVEHCTGIAEVMGSNPVHA